MQNTNFTIEPYVDVFCDCGLQLTVRKVNYDRRDACVTVDVEEHSCPPKEDK